MSERVDGGGGAAPSPLVITAGGVTVTVRPVGWRDLVELPQALERLGQMPVQTDADVVALQDALLAFAARIDAYAVGRPLPSDVPPVAMADFVARWVAGVRDAAVPPATADASQRRASRSQRGGRQSSRQS